MMDVGTKVRVKAASQQPYAGRVGVVVPFDPSLDWVSPRALLCPEACVFVHLLPKGAREQRSKLTPILAMFDCELAVVAP